jgi:hypothetical protein
MHASTSPMLQQRLLFVESGYYLSKTATYDLTAQRKTFSLTLELIRRCRMLMMNEALRAMDPGALVSSQKLAG